MLSESSAGLRLALLLVLCCAWSEQGPTPGRLSPWQPHADRSRGYQGPHLMVGTRLALRGGQVGGGEPFGWEQGEGCDVEDWKRLAEKVCRAARMQAARSKCGATWRHSFSVCSH